MKRTNWKRRAEGMGRALARVSAELTETKALRDLLRSTIDSVKEQRGAMELARNTAIKERDELASYLMSAKIEMSSAGEGGADVLRAIERMAAECSNATTKLALERLASMCAERVCGRIRKAVELGNGKVRAQ